MREAQKRSFLPKPRFLRRLQRKAADRGLRDLFGPICRLFAVDGLSAVELHPDVGSARPTGGY